MFKKISHYYTAVEMNNCKALHLYSFIQLEGNINLPILSAKIKDPEQQEYSNKIIAYVDDVFTESLNSTNTRIKSQNWSARTILYKFINNYSFLQVNFKKEINFMVY